MNRNYAPLLALAKRLVVTLNQTTIPSEATLPPELPASRVIEAVAHFNNLKLARDPAWKDLQFQPVIDRADEAALPSWESVRAMMAFTSPDGHYKYSLDLSTDEEGKCFVHELSVGISELSPRLRGAVVLHARQSAEGYSLKFYPKHSNAEGLRVLSNWISSQARHAGYSTTYDESSADLFGLLQFTLLPY